MEGIIIEENNQIIREGMDMVMPDFDRYNLNQDFGELYYDDQEFIQVEVIDTLKGFSERLRFNAKPEYEEEIRKEVEEFNRVYKKTRNELLNYLENNELWNWTENDSNTYLKHSKGELKLNIHHRHRLSEKDEREVVETEKGPYDGAFSS